MLEFRSASSVNVSCDAVPAWLRGEVCHVAVHPAQPDGLPLIAHHTSEVLHHRHVTGGWRLPGAQRLLAECRGGDACLLGEGGEGAGRFVDTCPRVRVDVVARIGLVEHRDAQTRGLAEFLDGVRIRGSFLRRQGCAGLEAVAGCAAHRLVRAGHGVAEDEAVHLLIVDVAGCRGVQGAALLGVRVAGGVEGVDQHQAGLLLQRHQRDQVLRALASG